MNRIIPKQDIKYFNMSNSSRGRGDQDSGCLPITIIAIVLIAIYIWLASCNTPKHMVKVYPYGYYSRGKYKSNHNVPKAAKTDL